MPIGIWTETLTIHSLSGIQPANWPLPLSASLQNLLHLHERLLKTQVEVVIGEVKGQGVHKGYSTASCSVVCSAA